MSKSLVTAASVAAMSVSALGLAVVAAPAAQAAPQDCTVSKGIFDASATCAPDGGSNYVLHLDCVGLYASGPFPLYAIGPYKVLSYPFTPNGQTVNAACTGMGPGVFAVATNAYVEIYNP
ncbi:hypothetical protein LTV02_04775 [Nocardia yamanashiensis]|uniref:hypothetical protein n=1 Tax=Nocardia yamanashiensis TaxID=209247 RepID=UPI000A060ECA|nr:hypothetical protein [Nocardia yamanashiensis]UGT42732.1 hypothetical protein LTV02_04775 [Nocardia yamanashiensis]